MKKLEVIIASFLVHLSYFLTYLIPVKKNRVSIISYFKDDFGLEFSKIVERLNEQNVEVKTDLHSFNSSLLGKFKYLFSFIHQTYLFNTSKVIIVDGNSFVFSRIKAKEEIKVIQLWHSTGAIKKFGSETKRRYKIKPYDYIIVASDFFKEIYSNALSTPIDKVLSLGVAKTDYLFDSDFLKKEKSKLLTKYPDLIDKKIVLYAPTFRGDGIEDMSFQNALNDLSQQLGPQYQVITKLHPLVSKHAKADNFDVSDDDLYGLLYISDYVISDYSALIFDSIILNRNTIMYLYDLEKYTKNRGLCLDLDDFDVVKVYSQLELVEYITQGKAITYDELKSKYLSSIDGKSSERISDLILTILQEEE